MAGEQRTFRFRMSDGSELDKTGHIEERAYEGGLSRCQITMKALPAGFDPDTVVELALVDDDDTNGSLSAELLQVEGPIGRGNSLSLRASFRPPQPTISGAVWLGVVLPLLLASALTLVRFAAVLGSWLQPSADGLLGSFQAGYLKASGIVSVDGHVVAYELGRSVWPAVGCIVGMTAVRHRRRDLLILSGILLLFAAPFSLLGWLGGGVLGSAFNRNIRAFMSEVTTVLKRQPRSTA